MDTQLRTHAQEERISTGLPFVEALARRLAASMPHSIDIGDLVQDGMIGLIDAAHRFDESRGIKFETFAERRVRGSMIDALRRNAWPRGVRRVRRELEAAREATAGTRGVAYLSGMLSVLSIPIPVATEASKLDFPKFDQNDTYRT